MAPPRPASPLGQRTLERIAAIEDLHEFLNRLLPRSSGDDDGLSASAAYSIVRYFCAAPCYPAEPKINGASMPNLWRDLCAFLRIKRTEVAKQWVQSLLRALKKVTLIHHETKLQAYLNNLHNTPITTSRDWTRTMSAPHAFMVERLWDTYEAAKATLMIAIDAVLPSVVESSNMPDRDLLPTCPLRIPDYNTGGLRRASVAWAKSDLGWSGMLQRANPWLAEWIRQFAESASNIPSPVRSGSSRSRGRGGGRRSGRSRGRNTGTSSNSSWTFGQSPFTSSASSSSEAGPATGPGQPPPQQSHRQSRSRQPPPSPGSRSRQQRQQPRQPPRPQQQQQHQPPPPPPPPQQPQQPPPPYSPPDMPPTADPAAGPYLGLAAIDPVPASVCAFSIFRTINVPTAFEGAFVRAAGDVLRWHRAASSANDTVGINRSLKWNFALPQLLLRRPRFKGPRGARELRARFKMWEDGNLSDLVGRWQHDVDASHPSQVFYTARRARTDMQAVHHALRLFYDGQLSKCKSFLTSNGLGDLSKPEFLAQFQAKFPERQAPSDFVSPNLSDYTGPNPPLPDVVDLKEYCRKAKRYAGVGPSGLRNEHIQLFGITYDDVILAETISLLNRHQHQVVCGQHPSWWYYLNGAANLLFIHKKPLSAAEVAGTAVPDGRPVGVGDNMRRLTQKAYGDANHDAWEAWLGPCQFGFTPNGGAKIYFTLHEMMWLHSDNDSGRDIPSEEHLVVVKLDLKNCWNMYKRARVFHRIAAGPSDVQRDLPQMHAYGQHSLLSFHAGKPVPGCNSALGGQQGASTSSREGCASFRDELNDSHAHVSGISGGRGGHFAFYDDSYIVVQASAALGCLQRFESAVAASGHDLVWSKCAWWCADPNVARDIVASGVMGAVPRGAVVLPSGSTAYGVEVDGVGLGDVPFQDFHAAKRVNKAASTYQTLESKLHFADPCALLRLLIHCVAPATVHDCRRVRPAVLKPHAIRFHTALLEAVGRTLSLYKPDDRTQLDILCLERTSLRLKYGGLGLTPTQDVCDAGYFAACLECIPSLINSRSGGSTAVSASHSSLVQFFSAGAFDDQSLDWSSWLQSFSPTAAEFQLTFDRIVVGLTPDGLPPVLHGTVQTVGSGEPLFQTQRQISRVFSKRRLQQYKLQLSVLPPNDRRRVAFAHHSATGTAWLQDARRCDPQLLFEVAAIFFGLPSPACAPFVGQKLPDGRPLDSHGDVLFNTNFRGFGWRNVHDAVLHVFVNGLKALGLEAVEEVWGLFRSALPNTAECNEHYQTRRSRRGLCPDALVTLETFERVLVELKTIQYNGTWYKHPDRPGNSSGVELRARKIPQEYIDKAKAADVKWNGTPAIPGVEGPVLTRLKQLQSSMGNPVLPIVAGAFGEINKAFDGLLKHAAQVGAERLFRRMRLSSAPSAKGYLLQQFRVNIGSTILRGRGTMLLAKLSHVGPTAAQASRRNRRTAERVFFHPVGIEQLGAFFSSGGLNGCGG